MVKHRPIKQLWAVLTQRLVSYLVRVTLEVWAIKRVSEEFAVTV